MGCREHLFYVPSVKFLGGHLAFSVAQPTVANGSLTVPAFGISGGGFGITDTYVQPFTLGWSTNRIAFYTGYAFFAPTGRYSPGASNNIGSGYWGNHFLTGTTLYLTKNQGTSANLFAESVFRAVGVSIVLHVFLSSGLVWCCGPGEPSPVH